MPTATSVREHRWSQRPAEDGDGQEIFCSGCGVISGREKTDECPAADLDEATSELGVKPTVIEQVAKAIGAMASDAQAIERDAKVENGVAEPAADGPPPAPRLPFPAPPFDAERWAERIEAKNDAVRAAASSWDSAEAQSKKARKRANDAHEYYEREAKELSDLIVLRRDEKHAAMQMQPRLNLDSRAADRALLLCSFEKTHGERCYLCRPIIGDAPEPRADEHDTAAGEAWRAYLETLAPELLSAGYMVDVDDLEVMTDEEVEAARAWIASDHVARPTFVGEAHVAAEADEAVQHCARCDAPLMDLAKGDQALAPGTFVGANCEPDADAEADESESEV